MTTLTALPIAAELLENPDAVGDAYVTFIGRTGLADATKRAYASEVRSFCTWLADQDKHRVDEALADPHGRDFATRDYRRYLLVERKREPKGVQLTQTALSSFYTWLGLGAPGWKKQTLPRPAPRGLTRDEAQRVLRAAQRRGPRDAALLALGIRVGLRVSEIAALDVDDVWTSARKGELQVRAGKGDRPRKVPLSAEAREAYDRWFTARAALPGVDAHAGPVFLTREGRRMSVRTIRHVVDEVGQAAGVDLSPHVLRHTFGRLMVEAGVDMPTLAEWMGHSSIETTRGYSRPSADASHELIERLVIDL